MSILLGAIFFMLIQAGLQHGYKKAYIIASGVITGDIIFITITISFTAFISLFLKEHKTAIFLVGGILITLMGIIALFKKPTEIEKQSSGFGNAKDYYIKPFLVNFLNPGNAAWWLGLYSLPPASDYLLNQKIAFACGAVLTVFFTEIGVAYGASKLKKYMSTKILKRVDIFAGIFFILLGMRLFANAAGFF